MSEKSPAKAKAKSTSSISKRSLQAPHPATEANPVEWDGPDYSLVAPAFVELDVVMRQPAIRPHDEENPEASEPPPSASTTRKLLRRNPDLPWLPNEWTSRDAPRELSVPAILDWIEFLCGNRGYFDFLGKVSSVRSYIEDAERLVVAMRLSENVEVDSTRCSLLKVRAELNKLRNALQKLGDKPGAVTVNQAPSNEQSDSPANALYQFAKSLSGAKARPILELFIQRSVIPKDEVLKTFYGNSSDASKESLKKLVSRLNKSLFENFHFYEISFAGDMMKFSKSH